MQEREQQTKCSVIPLFCLITFSIYGTEVPERIVL